MPKPAHPPIAMKAYERLAERYNRRAPTKAHNAHYDRPATLSLLPDVRGRQVLDAGCGPGIYSEWLINEGARVIAFDVSSRMVGFARRRLGNRAEVLEANLEEGLGFLEDHTIDVVLCPLVLDYIRDWQQAFAEFSRVLKPGGLVVCSISHPAPDYFLYHSGGNYFEVETVIERWLFGRDGDPVEMPRYRHSLGHLFDALGSAGLIVEKFLEPRPTEAFRETEPENYDTLMRRPGFLCIRAKKPA